MHNYRVFPSNALTGEVNLPGDKSISQRAVILAAMANGITQIINFSQGRDCLATLNALRQLGIRWEKNEKQLSIHGVGRQGFQTASATLNLENSATGLRLLTGVLATQNFDSELTGDDTLQKRPMERIAIPLRQMGAVIETTNGCAPLKIKRCATLKAINYSLPIASAQLKSCLLFAAINAQGMTTITESIISRDHTEKLLQSFSYPGFSTEGLQINLEGQHELIATDITVPNDLSAAAFFIVAAAITPNSDLLIPAVGINPTRSGVIDILRRMGADITCYNERFFNNEVVADIRVRYAPLTAINITADQVPAAIDEFPILFIAAAFAKGRTSIKGITELRYKESDRIASMVNSLNRLGITTWVNGDEVEIEGGIVQGGEVDSCDDHRVAMAFVIAAHNALKPVTIRNCHHVPTSFPNFVKSASQVGIVISEEISDV